MGNDHLSGPGQRCGETAARRVSAFTGPAAQPVTEHTEPARPGNSRPDTGPTAAPPVKAAPAEPAPDIEPVRPGWRDRRRRRRIAAAEGRAGRPNRHPYPDLLEW